MMKRLAVGYEFICRIIMMAAVYSWGRMPGMDIHTVEPLEKKR